MSWFTSNQPPAQQAQTNTGNLPSWWPTATPAPTTPPAPGTPPATIGPLTPAAGTHPFDPLRDPEAIRKAIDDAAKKQGRPGATEQDIQYWTKQILDNGGLTQYWIDKLAHGGDAGGGNSNDANFGTPPAPYQSAPWTGGDYTAPVFTAPTGVDEQNDPGYQFRLDQSTRAFDRSASAHGTLLSGGTIVGRDRNAQANASNEYQNVYNRALSTYGANAQAGEAQYQNRYAAYLGENARTLQDYLTNYNVTHTAQSDYWNRLKDLQSGGIATLN